MLINYQTLCVYRPKTNRIVCLLTKIFLYQYTVFSLILIHELIEHYCRNSFENEFFAILFSNIRTNAKLAFNLQNNTHIRISISGSKRRKGHFGHFFLHIFQRVERSYHVKRKWEYKWASECIIPPAYLTCSLLLDTIEANQFIK